MRQRLGGLRLGGVSLWLGAVAVGLLGACGSDHAAAPTPTPTATPVTTGAFVHVYYVVDAGASSYSPGLMTFSVNPGTGLLSLAGTMPLRSGSPVAVSDGTALAADPSETVVAADPQGRFVYYESNDSNDRGVRSYRVDATGALTPVSEAKHNLWGRLVPAAQHLYLGTKCDYPDYGVSISLPTFFLRLLSVDTGGVLGTPQILASNECWVPDPSGTRYHTFLAADPDLDILYTYTELGASLITAAALDSSSGSVGLREIAVLDLMRPGGGLGPIEMDEPYNNVCLAARGLFFIVDDKRSLYSLDLIDPSVSPVARGLIPDAAEPTMRMAYAPPRLLAVATPHQYVQPGYSWAVTGIHLYQVGGGGELSLLSALPDGSFDNILSFAFHPSGRFLYVAGVVSDRLPTTSSEQATSASAQTVSLLTFSVEPDGSLRLFGSVPIGTYDQRTLAQQRFGTIVVTAPPS